MQSDQQFFQIVQAGAVAAIVSAGFGFIIMVFVGRMFSFLRDILGELQMLNGHGVTGAGEGERPVRLEHVAGSDGEEQRL